MQDTPEAVLDVAHRSGCIFLADRPLRISNQRNAILASVIMTAIAPADFGLGRTAVSRAAGIVASVVMGVLRIRRMDEAIDQLMITLLAALIPVAGAIASTGAAD